MNAPSRLLRIIHRSPLNRIRRSTQGVAALFALAFAAAACGDDPVDPDLEPPAISPDRDVLVALYNATDGGNWRRNTNWLSDAPVNEWHGVFTDDGGRVRRLMLSTNGLQGPLPAVLAELPELRFLALARNQLNGPLPPELGSLQQVDSLFLNDNRLTGIIPGSFLQLDGLDAFRFGDNEGLCLPVNSSFSAWAERIAYLDGPGCAERDTEVLEFLYSTTDGPQWTNAGGWLGEEPLSEWYGVETDSIGRVMSLRLAGNGLSGTLPESLGQRTVGSPNHGRRSRKSNWDCTICHSCHCTGPCWTVPRKRENRNRFAGIAGVVMSFQSGDLTRSHFAGSRGAKYAHGLIGTPLDFLANPSWPCTI